MQLQCCCRQPAAALAQLEQHNTQYVAAQPNAQLSQQLPGQTGDQAAKRAVAPNAQWHIVISSLRLAHTDQAVCQGSLALPLCQALTFGRVLASGPVALLQVLQNSSRH